MKKITSLLLLWVMTLPLWAQFHDPVSFSVSQKKLSESEFEIVFTGKAEAGWHVYSTDIPDGGPTPATINFDEQKGVEPVGKLTARGKVHTTIFSGWKSAIWRIRLFSCRKCVLRTLLIP